MACLFAGWAILSGAQSIKFELGKDSTFNAADDYAQTSEGFDVDISQVNVINLGIQVAQDVGVANANRDEVVDALNTRSYYRQRVDLTVTSALPEFGQLCVRISVLWPHGFGGNLCTRVRA